MARAKIVIDLILFVSFFALAINKGKKSTSPPQLWGMDYLTPLIIKRSIVPHELFKTGQITPQAILKRRISSWLVQSFCCRF
jgi:hypothetical protein